MSMASLPSFYLSAPTSPYGCSPDSHRFYSARSSPVQRVGSSAFGYESGAEKTDGDEFEFGTNEWDDEYRLPARANSFSTIAFADELFCNGRVLPLKLPPRLQSSVPTSPRSLSSRMRKPFVQQCTWNDDFDPFVIALEKVSEETGGRTSVHRRSRSYSPFRTHAISHNQDYTVEWDQQEPQHTRPERDMESKKQMITEMMERKGSMYSRWVRSQTMVRRAEVTVQQTPSSHTMIKRLWLGKRVRDADFRQDKPVKPMKQTDLESKMQKVKSVLLRYTSLKKETGESKQSRGIMTISKISYFKRLTLSFKTNRSKKNR